MLTLLNSKFGGFTLRSILLVILMAVPSYSMNDIEIYAISEQHPANTIWIEPLSVGISDIGDKFNITVFVNITLKSFAWQVKLYFNSTFFEVTKIGYTNGNKSDFFSGYSSIPINPSINNEDGYILHGESLLSNDEKVPGYGSLFWVEFNLTQIPPQNRSTLYFSMPYGIDTFILTPYLVVIPMDEVNGVNISVEPTGSPPFPDLITLIIIAIVLVIVVVIVILMRRRKPEKHEKHEN